MSAYHLTLFTHAGLGVFALLTFWVAALAKKGSGPHKLAGKAYVLVMAGLLVPAIPLSWRALVHFSTVFGLFLFYLVVITGTALWRAWTAVKRKRDFAAYANANFKRLAWLNIASGAAILGVGAAATQPVLLGFSIVGILAGRGMLQLAQDGPPHARWWMRDHINAMLGCGVATHIAFLLIGLPRVLPAAWNGPTLQTVGWLGPLLVSGIAGRLLAKKYLPQPAPKAAGWLQSLRTNSPLSTLRVAVAPPAGQELKPSK